MADPCGMMDSPQILDRQEIFQKARELFVLTEKLVAPDSIESIAIKNIRGMIFYLQVLLADVQSEFRVKVNDIHDTLRQYAVDANSIQRRQSTSLSVLVDEICYKYPTITRDNIIGLLEDDPVLVASLLGIDRSTVVKTLFNLYVLQNDPLPSQAEGLPTQGTILCKGKSVQQTIGDILKLFLICLCILRWIL